jgi:hypothetical protein
MGDHSLEQIIIKGKNDEENPGDCARGGGRGGAERVVRDRYDGRKRNPFDEAECGHHYARALAAWTVLKAMEETKK